MHRIPYKSYPIDSVFPTLKEVWVPIINIALVVNHVTSKKFEAVVDSGSPVSLFHTEIGKATGVKIKDGVRGVLRGVVGGATGDVYYHEVKVKLVSDIINVLCGFTDALPVAAILGRQGFFESYSITFDPCNNPPGLIIDRIYRA